MSSRLARSLPAVLLVVLVPITAQAQFGKLISKAKALRSNVDSAKAVVDTSKTVVVAAKGAVSDATSGLPAPDSSAGGAGGNHAKGSGGSAAASGPAAGGTGAGGAAAASGPTKATNGAAAASSATQPAKPATTTAPATTRPASTGAMPLTEGVFAQFMRGASAEDAYHASKPTDARGAVSAGVSASGLTRADFAAVQSKVNTYAAYVLGNKEAVLPKILPPGDLTVLSAHKSEILQVVKAETPAPTRR